MRAATIRARTQHLWLIDEEFRQNPRNHRLFLEILRAPVGVTHELRRMNLYGVLGRYIPAFGRIVGRMQYDLFHAYTVDAHTLFVVATCGGWRCRSTTTSSRSCRAIMQPLPKPEIAYLAALFHDIAKGRGGDHSELGAVDAEAFCLEQGLSRYDARLVAWLVRNHLVLSVTAQKKDISRPEGHQRVRAHGRRPDAPRLPVCADRRRRARHEPEAVELLEGIAVPRFYERVKRALRRGLESPIDQEELIARDAGARARAARARWPCAEAAVDASGQRFTDAYFLRHTPEEIAWHTHVARGARTRRRGAAGGGAADAAERGGTAVSTFAPHRQHSFARTTAVLDQLGLNIVDARITPTRRRLQPRPLSRARRQRRSRSRDRAAHREIEQQLWRALLRSRQ